MPYLYLSRQAGKYFFAVKLNFDTIVFIAGLFLINQGANVYACCLLILSLVILVFLLCFLQNNCLLFAIVVFNCLL